MGKNDQYSEKYWYCRDCGFRNWIKRETCKRCDEQKEAAARAAPELGVASTQGGWHCYHCGELHAQAWSACPVEPTKETWNPAYVREWPGATVDAAVSSVASQVVGPGKGVTGEGPAVAKGGSALAIRAASPAKGGVKGGSVKSSRPLLAAAAQGKSNLPPSGPAGAAPTPLDPTEAAAAAVKAQFSAAALEAQGLCPVFVLSGQCPFG